MKHAIKLGESSSLKEKEHNRYWEIKFSRTGFLSGGKGLLNGICWHLMTLAMVLPLLLAARFYGLRRKHRAAPRGASSEIQYDKFTGIYPGCVYSPLVKSYELRLFGSVNFEQPILEIGIGDGYFSSVLFSSRKHKVSFGSDLAFEMLKRSRIYGHCDKYLIMDALEIPLPDNSIGTVIMNNLMHHLPSRASALKELLRVLKKGGRLIFTDNKEGWGSFTWEQSALKKMGFKALSRKIFTFKLQLFAQNLLLDDHYYEKTAKELGFDVKEKVNFISERSMFLSSLFEFLNLKQGQPTRPQMRRWLSLFGLENTMKRYMADIIEECYARDKKDCADSGSAFQFIVLEKTGGSAKAAEEIDFVCPRCKKAMDKKYDFYDCCSCGSKYPVVEGMPVFLSYIKQLKGMDRYLAEKKNEPVKEYMT